MKLTASQLRQIIKEELQSTLQESGGVISGSKWRKGVEAVQDMSLTGDALSEEQIEDLARTDRGTLEVYEKLISDEHQSLGVMGEKIQKKVGKSDWKAHKEYVRKFLAEEGKLT